MAITSNTPMLLPLLLMTLMVKLTAAAETEPGPGPGPGQCRDRCGKVTVRYPFGTARGCGDPRFARYVTCQNNTLWLHTRSGDYAVTSVDYGDRVLLLRDPLMSTCSSMQNSGSFALDTVAPFRLKNDVFVLLGCSSSSPLFDPHEPLCDSGSSHICSALYSCPALPSLGLPQNSPISSCCVYSPLNLGSEAQLPLPRLQCSSYSAIYSFGDAPADPKRWRYGIALQYSYSLPNSNSYFASSCSLCQQSGGICGYAPPADSFLCLCRNGVNTSTNCYGQGLVWNAAAPRASFLAISTAMFAGIWLLGALIIPH